MSVHVPSKLAHLPVREGVPVPWVTAWSEEREFSVRVCRHVKRPAVHVVPAIGAGEPLWHIQNPVRCREAVFTGRCYLCGGRLSRRWGFDIGGEASFRGFSRYVLRLPPACFTCATFALEHYTHPQIVGVTRVVQVRRGDPVCPVHTIEDLREGFPGIAELADERGVTGLAFTAVIEGEWEGREEFLARSSP